MYIILCVSYGKEKEFLKYIYLHGYVFHRIYHEYMGLGVFSLYAIEVKVKEIEGVLGIKDKINR